MNTALLRYILLSGVVFFAIGAMGQSWRVTGIVTDKNSQQPLEYATVSLYQLADSSLINGVITSADGRFQLESPTDKIYAQITYLGYKTITVDQFEKTGNTINIGTQAIAPDAETLEEAVVVAEKSQTTFHLDKRVFNVGKDLSSAGGSALDVLNNVPSVEVDIEGSISLRGNTNAQILINGKPSVMTSGNNNALGTITSDMIEKVEVITNPSAKYDAEGTTGIINIVLKKDERKGLNGSISVNTGVPNNHSVGVSLNHRSEKVNIFSQLGIGYRSFVSDREGETLDRTSNSGRLTYNGDREKNEQFYNVLLGADYHINKLNVITLSGHLGYEIESEFATTTFQNYSGGGALENAHERDEETDAINPKWQYELQYKKSFENNKDRSLTAGFISSYFGKDKDSEFKELSLSGINTGNDQDYTTDFAEANYTFQTDYVHPFAFGSELEVGAKYDYSDIGNDYRVRNRVNGDWVVDPNFTNNFTFDQHVVAAYTTFAHEWDKLGAKAGVRMEQTNIETYLENADSTSTQDYLDFFPSAHVSYKLSDQHSMQVGYSKRIYRPGMWELNPFTSFSNNLNISAGNPALKPEYTDSYELTYIHTGKKFSMSSAIFYRHTNNVINDIIQVQDSLSLSTPFNVGESDNIGFEFNGKTEVTKWMTLMGDFNWMYFERTGDYEGTNFDFENDNWSARLTSKFKLPYAIDMEWKFNYRSEREEVLSTRKAIFRTDFGLRKKIMKGKAVVNFSVRDVFATRKYENVSDQPGFYLYSSNQPQRRVVIGFSYGFGKGEAMEFSGHKMF